MSPFSSSSLLQVGVWKKSLPLAKLASQADDRAHFLLFDVGYVLPPGLDALIFDLNDLSIEQARHLPGLRPEVCLLGFNPLNGQIRLEISGALPWEHLQPLLSVLWTLV